MKSGVLLFVQQAQGMHILRNLFSPVNRKNILTFVRVVQSHIQAQLSLFPQVHLVFPLDAAFHIKSN